MAELLSACEAADVCKVSERTIRNWISAGKLPAERTTAGFRAEKHAATSGKNGNGAEVSADLSDLVALVCELIPKAEAAAMWQARAEMLAGQLEQAQLALAAPREPASPERPFSDDSVGLASEATQNAGLAVETRALVAVLAHVSRSTIAGYEPGEASRGQVRRVRPPAQRPQSVHASDLPCRHCCKCTRPDSSGL